MLIIKKDKTIEICTHTQANSLVLNIIHNFCMLFKL